MTMKRDVEEARTDGIERVQKGMTADEARNLREAVMHVVATRETFTSDDVWAVLLARSQAIREPRALGCVLEGLWHDGKIESADRFVPSRRRACHGRRIQVWRSVTSRLVVVPGAREHPGQTTPSPDPPSLPRFGVTGGNEIPGSGPITVHDLVAETARGMKRAVEFLKKASETDPGASS